MILKAKLTPYKRTAEASTLSQQDEETREGVLSLFDISLVRKLDKQSCIVTLKGQDWVCDKSFDEVVTAKADFLEECEVVEVAKYNQLQDKYIKTLEDLLELSHKYHSVMADKLQKADIWRLEDEYVKYGW